VSVDTQLPLHLTKAQLAFWLSTTALLQDGRQRWLEHATKTIGENIEETQAVASQLHSCEDWQALAALPGHAAWRLMNRQMGGLQAIAQTALSNQAQWGTGWQQALAAWQQASAQALSLAGNAMPLHASLNEFVKLWRPLPAAAAESVNKATAKGKANHG